MTEFKLWHGKQPLTSFVLNSCGATVTSWQVEGKEMLFLSSKAVMNGSKAIRGGIPLCFPQFGPWDNGRPQHGIARISSAWKEARNVEKDNGDVELQMMLTENEDTLKLWPHKFEFVYTVTLTTHSLELHADIKNTGDTEFDFTFCFHTYLRVNNIVDVSIKGLQSLTYVDKTKFGERLLENNSEVRINEFIDRVYENAPDDHVHVLLGGLREMHFKKTNLRDYVVWNPWSENCKNMADMDDDGYLHMICVEAAQDSRRIYVKPGDSWQANHTVTLNGCDSNI